MLLSGAWTLVWREAFKAGYLTTAEAMAPSLPECSLARLSVLAHGIASV